MKPRGSDEAGFGSFSTHLGAPTVFTSLLLGAFLVDLFRTATFCFKGVFLALFLDSKLECF